MDQNSTIKIVWGYLKSLHPLVRWSCFGAVCFTSGYFIGNQAFFNHKNAISVQEEQLTKLQQRIDAQQQSLSASHVELEIQKSANLIMKDELVLLQRKNLELEKDNTFYEKVVAPEKADQGIAINKFSIEETASPNRFRVRFILVQNNIKKRYARGYVNLILDGVDKEADKQSHKIQDISEFTDELLRFNFRYFQAFDQELVLPEGFSPEMISMSVILPKMKWQDFQRVDDKFSWQNLRQGILE